MVVVGQRMLAILDFVSFSLPAVLRRRRRIWTAAASRSGSSISPRSSWPHITGGLAQVPDRHESRHVGHFGAATADCAADRQRAHPAF